MDCKATAGKCKFIEDLAGAMPYTAKVVRINYCLGAAQRCAREAEHVILNIDRELSHLAPGMHNDLEIVEKIYYGGYRELRVRSR